MNIEIIHNKLYKAYLESFYKFCTLLGGTTADAMCPILEVSVCPPSHLLVPWGGQA